MSRLRTYKRRHIETAENQPLLYPELLENLKGIAVQSGLSTEDVEAVLVEQLRKLVTKNYQGHPDEEADVIAEKSPRKTLEFYNVAGGKREPLPFPRYRRDTSEFLNKLVAHLDAMRAEREYQAYADRKYTAVECLVQRGEFKGYVVDIEPDNPKNERARFKARGFLPKCEAINSLVEQRRLRKGEKIWAFITEIKTADVKGNMSKRLDDCGPRIMLSRIHPGLILELFKRTCREVEEGEVKIVKVVRSAGVQAKVAVVSTRRSIDAVGACLGPHSTRIKSISSELSDERVQVVQWEEDLKTFVESALAPGRVVSCTVHPASSPEDRPFVEVVAASQEDRRKMIGHSGTNVYLACRLTDTRINVLERVNLERAELSSRRRDRLVEFLHIDVELADRLMEYGYSSTFALCYSSPEDLAQIPGLDAEIAAALVERAEEGAEDEINSLKEELLVQQNLLDWLSERKKLHLIYNLVNANIRDLPSARKAYEEMGGGDTDDMAIFTLRACLPEIFDEEQPCPGPVPCDSHEGLRRKRKSEEIDSSETYQEPLKEDTKRKKPF